MARFKMELPREIIDDIKKVRDSSAEIFGAMTRAGAEVVAENVRATVPLPEMKEHVKLTRIYITPTDDGINTKVYLHGYLPFKGNRRLFVRRGREGGEVYVTTKGVPVGFLAQVYEYGRSTAPFPKRPFFRKAFNREQITKAMLKAQKEASGGLLDE